MNLRLSLALAACGLAVAGSGCTTPTAAFRGQSPEMSAMPAGFNPHDYGVGEQYYSGTQGFSGGGYYGGGGPQMSPRRQQKFMERGILPPGDSPYAFGYVPTPKVDPNANPDRVVEGVKMYDAYAQGWRAPACPAGTPWTECRGKPYDLMPGGCPVSGADYIHWMPTHYETFAYHRPADLTYPSQNSVGGAVAYTYYTLKGPGDFFRDADGVY